MPNDLNARSANLKGQLTSIEALEAELKEVRNEWEECRLGDVLELQRGFDLPTQERMHGTYPIVASTGAVGFHSEAMVNAPGVVIGRSGSIGGGQYVTHNFWPLNTTLWVKDSKGMTSGFVSIC